MASFQDTGTLDLGAGLDDLTGRLSSRLLLNRQQQPPCHITLPTPLHQETLSSRNGLTHVPDLSHEILDDTYPPSLMNPYQPSTHLSKESSQLALATYSAQRSR